MKLCEKHAGLPGAPRADGSCRWCEHEFDGETFRYEDHGPMAEWTQRLFCKPTFVVPSKPEDVHAQAQQEFAECIQREIDGAYAQMDREFTAYDAMAKSTLAGSHLMRITLPSSEPVSPERAAKQREQDEICRVLRRDKERAKLWAGLTSGAALRAQDDVVMRRLRDALDSPSAKDLDERNRKATRWSTCELYARAGMLTKQSASDLLEADAPDAWFEPDEPEPAPRTPYGQALDAAEALWGVVANASGGDWSQQSQEWQDAAARARELYELAKTWRKRAAEDGPFSERDE